MRGQKKGRRGSFGGARRIKKLVLDPDEPLEYKNVDHLRKCLGSQGQILSRRRTGLPAQRQRDLKIAIKRARHLALLPFIG